MIKSGMSVIREAARKTGFGAVLVLRPTLKPGVTSVFGITLL